MLQNSYDNYTQKPQLNAKLKVLRKIIAFVFAINMLITRFFGGPAGTQLRQAEVFTDSSASQNICDRQCLQHRFAFDFIGGGF